MKAGNKRMSGIFKRDKNQINPMKLRRNNPPPQAPQNIQLGNLNLTPSGPIGRESEQQYQNRMNSMRNMFSDDLKLGAAAAAQMEGRTGALGQPRGGIAEALRQPMGTPQAPQQGMFQGLMGALNKVPKQPVAPMQSEMNAAPEVPATEQTQDAIEPAPAAAQAQSEQPAPEQDNSAIDAQIAQLQQQIAQLQSQKK